MMNEERRKKKDQTGNHGQSLIHNTTKQPDVFEHILPNSSSL